jgi:hypothetical protein
VRGLVRVGFGNREIWFGLVWLKRCLILGRFGLEEEGLVIVRLNG